MSRPKGHHRAAAPPTGAIAHTGAPWLGASFGTSGRVPAIPEDQSITSSCTGYGYVKQPVDVAARRAGGRIVRASAMTAYKLGRALAIAAPMQPLVDGGCDPMAVVDAARIVGVAAEDLDLDDPALVNERVDLLTIERAHPFVIRDVAVIAVNGDARTDAICRAIASGYGVSFGMSVDEAYEQLEGRTLYEGLRGPSLGGHAQYICGFEEHDGYVDFEIAGSWGPSFGAAGFAHISSRFISSDENCFDFVIARAVPRLSEAV